LQITVWGDYGRIERKSFMGIAQIQLDDLNLANPVIGWYKLFHSSSITQAAAKKDEAQAAEEEKPKSGSRHHNKSAS